MSEVISAELAEKVERLFSDRGAPGIDAQALARALAKYDIVLTDASRTTFLVDVRVHEGALYRSALYRKRNDQLEAWAAHVMPATGVWRQLSQQGD